MTSALTISFLKISSQLKSPVLDQSSSESAATTAATITRAAIAAGKEMRLFYCGSTVEVVKITCSTPLKSWTGGYFLYQINISTFLFTF